MTDYKKTIEARQQEADKIRSDLDKAEKRVTLLRQKLAKKNKEIRDLLKADREQWLKVMMEKLDTAFAQKNGDHYWQDMAHEDVIGLVTGKATGSDTEDVHDAFASHDNGSDTKRVRDGREEA